MSVHRTLVASAAAVVAALTAQGVSPTTIARTTGQSVQCQKLLLSDTLGFQQNCPSSELHLLAIIIFGGGVFLLIQFHREIFDLARDLAREGFESIKRQFDAHS